MTNNFTFSIAGAIVALFVALFFSTAISVTQAVSILACGDHDGITYHDDGHTVGDDHDEAEHLDGHVFGDNHDEYDHLDGHTLNPDGHDEYDHLDGHVLGDDHDETDHLDGHAIGDDHDGSVAHDDSDWVCESETTMVFDLEKKFSGPVPDGYTADQFTFTIDGGDPIILTASTDDSAVSTVELGVGTYTIEEIGPGGFVRDDWTIQWSGAGCQNDGDSISTTITIDESDLDKGNFGCRADNQYKPVIDDPVLGCTDPDAINYNPSATDGNDEAGQCDYDVPEDTVKIVAQKIVCTVESELPNWGTGGPNITSSTAQDWVDANDSCEFESGWDFEWVGANEKTDPGDTLTGPAGGDWTTFGATDVNGMTIVSLDEDDINGNSDIWMREVLQSDYIPFSHEANPDNSNDVTAEFYCSIDVLNYDNYERIDDVKGGETYNCVAWNVPVAEEPQACIIDGYKYDEQGNPLTGWEIGLGGEFYEYLENDSGEYVYETYTDITDDDGYYCVEEYREGRTKEPGQNYQVGEVLQDDWSFFDVTVDGSSSTPAAGDSFFDIFVDIELPKFGETLQVNFYNEEDGGGEQPHEDTYRIEGYVWHDNNENTEWDGFEEEVPTEDEQSGWVVEITNGTDTFSTSTDGTGFYYFEVPAGTWTITEVLQEGWSLITPASGSFVVTVPELVTQSFVEKIFAFIVPTAYADVLGTVGPFNFGNNESSGGSTDCTSNCGGGRGGSSKPRCELFEETGGTLTWETRNGRDMTITSGGVEIFSTTDDDVIDEGEFVLGQSDSAPFELTLYRGSRSDTCTIDTFSGSGGSPDGEVLGEQVSVVPLGGANTGAGGGAPAPVSPLAPLATMFALLSLGMFNLKRNVG